jgi:hypothetical protein
MKSVPEIKRLTVLTAAIYWCTIVFGLTMPWIVLLVHDAYKRHVGLSEAFQDFRLHLFAPGFNFFLIGVLNAIPFVLFAVFVLFHLGTAAHLGRVIVSRRIAGVMGGLMTALAVSSWAHIVTIAYPDAQGALMYVFLPVYLLFLIPVGYGGGRLVAWLFFRLRRPV